MPTGFGSEGEIRGYTLDRATENWGVAMRKIAAGQDSSCVTAYCRSKPATPESLTQNLPHPGCNRLVIGLACSAPWVCRSSSDRPPTTEVENERSSQNCEERRRRQDSKLCGGDEGTDKAPKVRLGGSAPGILQIGSCHEWCRALALIAARIVIISVNLHPPPTTYDLPAISLPAAMRVQRATRGGVQGRRHSSIRSRSRFRCSLPQCGSRRSALRHCTFPGWCRRAENSPGP